MSQKGNKEELRKVMRNRRNSLSLNEIYAQTEKCFMHLQTMPEFQESEWIYCYLAIGSEVDTISLVSRFIKMGKKVAAPKVERDEIAFYEIGSIRECRPGVFGILEPASYKAPADEKGLILLPGLAFDMSGNRLGYGGGFYDKYLKSHPDYPCAALAFELQILDEVPHEEHDKTVDYIITPERIIVCH